MSHTEERFYFKEANEYLDEAGIHTYGIWRDLERAGLEVYKDGKSNWTTQENLDLLIESLEEKKEKHMSRGKKLENFSPDVTDEWRELCTQAERRQKLRQNIRLIRSSK